MHVRNTQVWVNGEACTSLDVMDRGLSYGDGLFETMRVSGGRVPLWSYHERRLVRSCDRLELPVDLALIQEELRRHTEGIDSAVIRLTVTRGSSERGYMPPENPHPTIIVLRTQAPSTSDTASGIRAAVLQSRIGISPMLGGLKHLNRLEQVMLRKELSHLSDCHEALVLDSRDHVVEGVFSNVFLVKNYVMHTPEIQDAGVAGVMRAFLMDRAREVRIPSRVRTLTVADFIDADEIFFCNSVMGIMPVSEFLGREYRMGAVTLKLREEVTKVFANGQTSLASPA